MHKTLQRQLRRIFGDDKKIPESCQPLLDMISETYTNFEDDHNLIERSLELSSRELNELNEKLRADNSATKKRADELKLLNEVMMGRELKMIELKNEIKSLREELRKQQSLQDHLSR